MVYQLRNITNRPITVSCGCINSNAQTSFHCDNNTIKCVYLNTSYRKVIWNICPKLTCWVLLLYPCSISPNRVSLKWTSCRGHFGPSQLSDCRRQERPSPASLYSCTHLRGGKSCQLIWWTIKSTLGYGGWRGKSGCVQLNSVNSFYRFNQVSKVRKKNVQISF